VHDIVNRLISWLLGDTSGEMNFIDVFVYFDAYFAISTGSAKTDVR